MTRLAIALVSMVGALGPAGALAAQSLSARFDFERPVARFELPGRLSEISGLDVSTELGLLGHGDERGLVYRIDTVARAADRGFALGEALVRDDFEGIASAGERIFMVSSRGLLYEFREAPEGAHAAVRITDTGLGPGCEIEGLAHHPASGHLVLVCKSTSPQIDEIRVHFLPLSPEASDRPPLSVPWSVFTPFGHRGAVNPSAVEVDSATGSLLLLAARQELLFEIDGTGALIDVVHLPKRRHPQPEGIALGPDGLLYIADEGSGGDAHLTVYGRRSGAPG